MSEVVAGAVPDLAVAGVRSRAIPRTTHAELHLTLWPLPGERPAELIHRLALMLRERAASIVRHEVFGSITAHAETVAALEREFGGLDWPVTWVDGGCANNILGMHIFAVSGSRTDTVWLHHKPVGRIYASGSMRHCLLGALTPPDRSESRPEQCRETFALMERALSQAGMTMTDLVRTSFYLDDILSWYGEFNQVRHDFYGRAMTRLPASTGVGGCNPAGTALVAGAWAMQATDHSANIRTVPSPMQCPAPQYGSGFSRAILIEEGDGRRLLVSGTASIAFNGQSEHIGDVGNQITLSMEVVQSILGAQGFCWADVTRATGYFKSAGDLSAFGTWQIGNEIPFIQTPMDICRDELLFEIELDVISG